MKTTAYFVFGAGCKSPPAVQSASGVSRRNRCNSDTDSDSLDERRRVWHFAMLFFDAYTLEGNFRVFTIEKERFL